MYRKFENLSLHLFDRFGGLVILALCLATVAIVVWAIYRTATIDRWQATGIMVLCSCLIAVPPLVTRFYLRYQR